ncbi:phage tail protein [Candidatus Pantoea alvi]|uniref:phage tail-collar fiber domain-containing protein n=1 Tax=Enterobacter agglomerans TaxID=549 RepID=UPI000CDDD6F8|nr:phage tail protein [Pantoea agglomerans]POW59025.1 phage tail protein [Pantoea alvi]UBN54919.1 phage tail protein [Pantoea agglomerans]
MTTKYYALLTNQGAAKLANATALGTKLQITEMAVGDGGGSLPTPNASQAGLVGEKRRAALNSLSVDANNSSQIIAEQIIPENEGGFWIREIGLFDADGVMIAVANCAETYKPQLQEGSGRTQTVRMIIIVNSTDAVTLKIDPSVVLATRQYVDNGVIEAKQYADKGLADHIAAANPHQQYLQIANALAEVKSAGKVAEVLQNLGLGEGSALPVGVPVPWPSATPPAGWLKCNGAAFTAAQYPKLAQVYPSLKLPDLRGEFIRGWDDGRGVDSGRALLTVQADELRSHNHRLINEYGTPSTNFIAFTDQNSEGVDGGLREGSRAWTYITMEKTGGSETRPHNIAFNYIVRAA